jgi:Transposase DDE domain/Transposase domain (DUF772)
MPLLTELSDLRGRLQGDLLPFLESNLGPLGPKYQQLVTVIEMVPVDAFLPRWGRGRGRPPYDRAPFARALFAKTIFNLPTTADLIVRLQCDETMRRLCGWGGPGSVPEAPMFSRVFAEFAATALPSRMHEALIVATHKGRLVEHISRDATAIEAREKAVKVKMPKPCRRKVKPQKGEPGWETVRRLERQGSMTLTEMLADLPSHCAVGAKRNAKGHKDYWVGYKLHLDIADGAIPITALLTSASLNDSQAAIPLATMTARRVANCYDLMDACYDAPEIDAACRDLGRVPIIPEQPRRDKKKKAQMAAEATARRAINFVAPEDIRYRQRTTAERVNARLKDEFGGRFVRVRGHAKVMCHLMFGILALTVDQLMRLVPG